MPQKKRMKKGKMQAMKKANLKPWILGNNPNDNNKCQCFKNKLPNQQWIAINSFPTQSICTSFFNSCSAFFMKMPLTKKQALQRHMGMGMGRMGMMH